MDVVKRFSIWLVSLDPTQGSEISKTRACLVVSPDVVNKSLKTVIVAPLTSTIKKYPTRVNTIVNGKSGQIALDQIRTVDQTRLIKQVDELERISARKVCTILQTLFTY